MTTMQYATPHLSINLIIILPTIEPTKRHAKKHI